MPLSFVLEAFNDLVDVWFVIVKHVELGELLIVDEAVEVRVDTFGIGAHKGKELGHNRFFLSLDRDLFGVDELKVLVHVVCAVVEGIEHLGRDSDLLPDTARDPIFKSGLSQPRNQKVLNDIIAVRLHTGRTLHLYIIIKLL